MFSYPVGGQLFPNSRGGGLEEGGPFKAGGFKIYIPPPLPKNAFWPKEGGDEISLQTSCHQKGTIRTETITNENQKILFRFHFCNGKTNQFPLLFYFSHLLSQ